MADDHHLTRARPVNKVRVLRARQHREVRRSGKNLRWNRAKTAYRPKQPADLRFPLDALGIRAKAAFEAWRRTLTPKDRRSLSRPARR